MTDEEWADFKAKIAGHTKGAWDDASRELVATVPTLVAEVERLREALAFYADLDGYGYHAAATDYGLSMELGDIIEDGGQRARAALTGSSQ